nr:hypothetical protein [Tanacetum cinerariifolium]
MAKDDEEKTSFITSQGVFCYSKMPFGLKNVRVTYQRLVDKAFQKQIGRNLEVYMDDLLIKSRTKHEIIRDMKETIKTLRETNMKLNPKKCTFKIEEGTFLGYKVNTEGTMSRPTRPGDQLPVNGKVGASFSTCKQKAKNILPGSHNHCHHRPANQAVERPKDDSLDTSMETKEELPDPWTLFTDGSSCIDGFRASLILTNTEGAEFTYALRFRSYIAKEPGMIQYLEKVKVLSNNFKKFSIKPVPRSKNKKSDALSKISSASFAHLTKQVLVEELKEKSINEAKVLAVMKEEGHAWMTQIYNYLTEETLPAKKKKARAVRLKSGSKGHTNMILLADNARGSKKLIRAYQDCQVYRPVSRNSQQKLTHIMSPWPFHKWGIDIAGPFPEGPRKFKFLIVAMDYFTKWIEAKPVATITAKIGMPTIRTVEVDIVQNDEALEINLDLLEEKRESKRSNEASHAKESGKISPK